jgi:hypothetical protein
VRDCCESDERSRRTTAALRVLDDHLETWVSDDTVRLHRELTAITEATNKENLLWSSTHYVRIGQAKERALQSYRD